MAEADFCVRGLVRVLQKAINPSVREHFRRRESLTPVFLWSFRFCRGSGHHTASLPLAGGSRASFSFEFLCFSFLFSIVAGELTQRLLQESPGFPYRCILIPVLTGNCSGTFSSCAGNDCQRQFSFHLLRRLLISVMIV